MNDPFILYAIARFGDTSILLNLVRASRQFHALVAENTGVRYDLMDCYAANGFVITSNRHMLLHGKFNSYAGIEYWRAGKLHRDGDLPAVIWDNGIKEWYHNGEHHRDGDLPALISDDTKAWYKHGKFHRDGDLPALIWMHYATNITDAWWYKNGILHRDGDQPTFKSYIGDSIWYNNGEKH